MIAPRPPRPICPAAVPEREERPPVVGIAMLVFVLGGLFCGVVLLVMTLLAEVLFLMEHGL